MMNMTMMMMMMMMMMIQGRVRGRLPARPDLAALAGGLVGFCPQRLHGVLRRGDRLEIGAMASPLMRTRASYRSKSLELVFHSTRRPGPASGEGHREIERFLPSSSVNCILMLQCTLPHCAPTAYPASFPFPSLIHSNPVSSLIDSRGELKE